MLFSPDLIIGVFGDLYASKTTFSSSELLTLLDTVSFPMLAAMDRERLEADISLEGVQVSDWASAGG